MCRIRVYRACAHFLVGSFGNSLWAASIVAVAGAPTGTVELRSMSTRESSVRGRCVTIPTVGYIEGSRFRCPVASVAGFEAFG